MGCCLSQTVDFENDEINLFFFELHRAVGRGAFGKVRVVEHKKTKKLYALKYIDKARCLKQKAVANVLQERRLLEEIDHPFVVNLRYAFQDDENCFFVLDLMLGGDLRFHLERRGGLSEDVVRFWTAELACALDYLRRQRIIHRDIKPDNILLDARGHAHLTDFNVALHYSERRQHSSVAGSMAYMAPQVVNKRGYSWHVDWWSLGVTIYELLFYKRPFDGKDNVRMTQSILKEPLRFPSDAHDKVSEAGLDVVRRLIERDPTKRFGCGSKEEGMKEVMEHPWFSNINWDTLETKEDQPPFALDMKHANFDVSHELDEFLMVEKPLTHTKRKANIDLDKLKPELRELEERFKVYDFSRSQRTSYYPENLPVQTLSIDSDQEKELALTRTDSLMPTATIAERSLAGTPIPNDTHAPAPPPMPPTRPSTDS